MSNETKTSNRGATIAITAVLAVAAIGAYHGIVNYEHYGEELETIKADMATIVENNNALVAASTAASEAAATALAAAEKASADAAAAARTAAAGGGAATADAGAAGEGWFTAEQVARGEESYQTICAMCHGDDVADSFGTFAGSANDMMNAFIGLGMPATNPGGLPPQQYIDIAAYIFNKGGMPLGAEVLAGSPEADQAGN